jgi:hypothetical protein
MTPVDFMWIEIKGMSVITAIFLSFYSFIFTGTMWWVLREIKRIDVLIMENRENTMSVDRVLDKLQIDVAVLRVSMTNIEGKMCEMAESMKNFYLKK